MATSRKRPSMGRSQEKNRANIQAGKKIELKMFSSLLKAECGLA